jgi:hypothetical protein
MKHRSNFTVMKPSIVAVPAAVLLHVGMHGDVACGTSGDDLAFSLMPLAEECAT